MAKPSLGYVVLAIVLGLQFLGAAFFASVPQREPHAWPAWVIGIGSVGTIVVYMAWHAIRKPTVEVALQDRWLVVRDPRGEKRFDVVQATVRHGRWAYPGMGGMGTIIEIAAPEGTLRIGLPVLVSAERYDLRDGYSFDIQVDPPAADPFLAALDRVTGTSGAPGYRAARGPTVFAVPLTGNRSRDTMIYVVLSFVFPMVLGLIVVPLSTGPSAGTVTAAVVGLVIGVTVVTYLVRRRREARRYVLELTGKELVLKDRLRGEEVTRCTPSDLTATATYYEVSSRRGRYKYPSLRLTLPGFEGEITIGGMGVDGAAWVARATKDEVPKYSAGLAEWNQLLRAIGWA